MQAAATNADADRSWVPVNVQRALCALKERLQRVYGPRVAELRLFGSFARGEQHGQSDVDVLVLFEDELHWKEMGPLFDEVAAVNVEARMWISPLILSRKRLQTMIEDEIQIALDIESEGIPF